VTARETFPAVRGLCPLLQVFDMPTSLRFYRDLLGFAEVEKSGEGDDVGWVLLRHGDAGLMLNTAYDEGERPESPDPERAAAHADTILFLGCEDLDGVHAHLARHGVQADRPTVAPYGMRQLYVRDPDGYGLCFQWPAGTTAGRRRRSRSPSRS
jgi:catechol 2,3-dioxygenase-like lactoylglutathione lyase family enzyme